jgi:hypothetical protein
MADKERGIDLQTTGNVGRFEHHLQHHRLNAGAATPAKPAVWSEVTSKRNAYSVLRLAF